MLEHLSLQCSECGATMCWALVRSYVAFKHVHSSIIILLNSSSRISSVKYTFVRQMCCTSFHPVSVGLVFFSSSPLPFAWRCCVSECCCMFNDTRDAKAIGRKANINVNKYISEIHKRDFSREQAGRLKSGWSYLNLVFRFIARTHTSERISSVQPLACTVRSETSTMHTLCD